MERYEKELHLFQGENENSQYLQQLADEEKISEELEKNLMDSIQTFNQRFFPEKVSEEKMGRNRANKYKQLMQGK